MSLIVKSESFTPKENELTKDTKSSSKIVRPLLSKNNNISEVEDYLEVFFLNFLIN